MANLVRLQTKSGPVLIEVSKSETNVRPVSALDEVIDSAETLEKGFQQLVAFAESFSACMQKIADKVETAELELGMQVTGKGSLFFVEAEGQAAIKAKLVFRPK